MLQIIKYTLILCLIPVLSACSGVDRFLIQNDAVGATDYLEKNGQTYQTVEPKMKYWMCHGYAELRRFREYFDCMEQFEKTIFEGEMVTASAEMVFGYQYTFNKDYTDADINTLKARVFFELGDYTKARKHASIAYKALTEGSPNCCGGLMSDRLSLLDEHIRSRAILALTHYYLGDIEASIHFQKELEDFDFGIKEKAWQAEQRAWLAKIYLANEDYQKTYRTIVEEDFDIDILGSINNIMQYEPISAALFAAVGNNPTERDYLHGLEYQAMVCRSLAGMKAYEKSTQCYTQLLEDHRIQRYGDLYFWSLKDLGHNHLKLQNHQKSWYYLQQAIQLIESQRSSILFDSGKIGFLENNNNVYYDTVEVLIALGKPQIAFEYVERAKSRALIDMLASKQQFGPQENNSNNIIIAELEKLELDSLSFIQPKQKTRQIRALKRKIKTQAPKLSSLTTVESQTFSELIDHLSENETLIEYFGTNDKWYAFIISKTKEGINNISIDIIELNGDKLESTIATLRQQLLNPEKTEYKKPAQALYKSLIQPIENKLVNKNITIVAHGPLHYLPFNVLFDGNKLLIEKYSIRFLPSTSVLSYLNTNTNQQKTLSLLAMGNPYLGNTAFDLAAAQKEVEAIGKVITKSTILVRKQATETALKSKAKNAQIIHIASHGEFDPLKPLNSRLLLAADDKNDGFLTVSDIYNLDLKANLVTLSACETGLGDIKKGDDVIGLTRGFLYAGASSIISSLWVVDDEATEKLMLTFYLNINLESKRDALRHAQLEIKNGYQEHPFYWAAFQLTGSL